MGQLVAIVQGGTTQYELDLPDTPIELNFQFQDLNDPLASKSPYTFNFNLPPSRNNVQFFSYYYDYNVTLGSFKAQTKTSVQLYSEGILLMEGVLQLYSASEEGFVVNVLQELASLFESIRDLSWEELFTDENGVDTDLDHALTWTNIINSWTTTNDITTGTVGDGVIVYPLADWGQNSTNNSANEGVGLGFTYAGSGTGIGINTGLAPLAAKNFKPAIRIQYVIDYIFKRAGINYESTFFDSADFKKIYMFLATETERATSRASYGFRMGIPSTQTITSANAGIYEQVSFTEESSAPFYDPDGLVSSSTFSAPYDGDYYLTARLIVMVQSVTDSTSFNVLCRMMVNGELVTNTQQVPCDPNETNVADYGYLLSLSQGDQVTVQVAHTNSFDDVSIITTNSTGTTLWQLISYDGTGGFVDVSSNFPDVSVDEWLRAICEKFNIVMITKPTDPGIVYAEPWEDWWNNGTTKKDYTNKVDADSISIEPTTKYQKKEYIFEDSEGEDFVNLWYQHHFRKTYGRYIYENDNDFATGKEETSDIFQPLRNRRVFQNIQNTGESLVPNVLIPTFWNWHDGSNGSIYLKEFVSCKPVLAYYNGLQSIGNGHQFSYGGTLYSNYPYFAEYNSVGVTTSTKSLQWGYTYPDNLDAPFVSNGDTAGITNNYLFNTYWLRMFNELYSDESRVMTCKLDVTTTDVYNLEFNDLLYIEGAYWRIISLNNFTLDNSTLANAELIKVIDAAAAITKRDCNLQVDSFNTDGTVNFVSATTGSAATATEECCTGNGFIWSESLTECFYKSGTNSNGSHPNAPSGIPQPISGHSNGLVPGLPGTNVVSKSFAFKNSTSIQGGTYTVQLYAETTSASAVNAKTADGIDTFDIPLDTIAYITYDVTMIEIGGSAAAVGEASNFTARTSIANTRDLASNAPAVRRVGGTPTVINTEKDSGVTASIDTATAQRVAGADATYTVQCTGEANVTASWLINATVQFVQLSGLDISTDPTAYFNLSNTKIHLNDGSNTELHFNK